MSPLELKPRVFLSYAVRDEPSALAASRTLQEAGCDVFSTFGSDDLVNGNNAFASFQDSLKEIDALILVASPDAVTSQWMAFEIGAALAWGKPVYVIADGGSPLPAYLQQTHVVRSSELMDLAQALRRETEPLSDAERKILSAVYVKIGVPSDNLIMDPDASTRLVNEFNRRSRSGASLNRLGRELLSLRKSGRLPRLGRTSRSVNNRQSA